MDRLHIRDAEHRNRLLHLQVRSQTQAADGQLVETWTDVAQVWAHIAPISGREMWLAKQAQARVTHRITILYRPGILPTMRATMNGRIFHFESVTNREELNEELEILATEQIAEQTASAVL